MLFLGDKDAPLLGECYWKLWLLRQTKTVTTIETRKRMYDAAVLARDYQNAWKNYMAEQNHHNAREVVNLGETLLEKQYETGLSMQSPTYIRHRVLIAQDYLDKNPEKETDKLAQLRSDLVEYGKRTRKI